MSFDSEIQRDKRLIRLTGTGELNADRAIALIDKISLTARLNPDYDILVDIQGTTLQPDMADLLDIASVSSKRLTDFKHKIAFLIPDMKERQKIAKLYKSYMELQGFEFRQFVKCDDAIDWLSKILA